MKLPYVDIPGMSRMRKSPVVGGIGRALGVPSANYK